MTASDFDFLRCRARREEGQADALQRRIVGSLVTGGKALLTSCAARYYFVVVIFFAASLLTAVADSTNRPAAWATKLTLSGVPNFYQVGSNLYRGAQPTAEGLKQLKAMGIKTVINLREFHSEKQMVEAAGMKSIRFEMSPLHAEEKAVVRFLQVVSDTNNWPVFFHCERGADRTGTMCAIYRITLCGWTKSEVIDEMKNGGYEFSPVWRNLVSFIEQADIDKIKREAGISSKVRSEARQ